MNVASALVASDPPPPLLTFHLLLTISNQDVQVYNLLTKYDAPNSLINETYKATVISLPIIIWWQSCDRLDRVGHTGRVLLKKWLCFSFNKNQKTCPALNMHQHSSPACILYVHAIDLL